MPLHALGESATMLSQATAWIVQSVCATATRTSADSTHKVALTTINALHDYWLFTMALYMLALHQIPS